MSENSFALSPIGFVRSCYTEKFGTPRQSGLVPEAGGFIELLPHVQPELSLDQLDQFSHLWVIFVFHKNLARFHAKIHPPRLLGQTVGLYATRTPHRPNNLGLSLLQMDRIDGAKVYVKGLDLIDGTPVLDIKPYLPQIESQPQARAGWTESLPAQNFTIEWSPAAAQFLQQDPRANLKIIIEDTLVLDPRPIVYRENLKDHYRTEHVFRLFNLDVHFIFDDSSSRIEVSQIVAVN